LGHRSKRASIEALLGDLVAARIGATFNQYREFGDKDVPGAPAIRLDNLRRYLEEREAARVLAVGEAAGYQGMRWSGIAFTSERDLARWAERKVVLWNTVPAHPFAEEALSNRRPTAEEIRQGAMYTRRLIEILEPATLIAVGRVAAAVLGDDAVYVRHPANAGASAFADGMRRALMSELPSCPS
jgi:hypothetical protein